MTEDLNKKIGNLLREKRKENGYSLEDVQLMLKKDLDIELDVSNISRYEAGTVKNMNPKFLRGLCKVNKLDYVKIFKELGYLDKDETDPRMANLTKREIKQYEDFMSEATLFFNDEKITEEDKQKLFNSLQDVFYRAKYLNKRKK